MTMGRRQPDESWGESGKRRSIAAAFPARAKPGKQPTPAHQRADRDDYRAAHDPGPPDDDSPSIPFAPLLTLPTLPAVQAPPAQRAPQPAQQAPNSGRLPPRPRPLTQAPNESDEDEWSWRAASDAHLSAASSPGASSPGASSPGASSPGASSPRMRSAAQATPLGMRWGGVAPDAAEPPRQTRWGDPAPSSRPSGKHRRAPLADPDAPVSLAPTPDRTLAPLSAPASGPLASAARRTLTHSGARETLSGVFIPGRNLTRRLIPAPARRWLTRPTLRTLEFVQRRRVALIALLLVALMTGLLVNVSGLSRAASLLSGSAWRTSAGATPLPTALIAPDTLDAGHYVNKYGFDWPSNPQALPGDEYTRLAYMLPFAILGANAADRRYNATIEPEMVVWWTHAEGIGGRINYSNCANQGTRPGTDYFTDIENCNHSSFWQLGYGNQFSVIYVLKDAFTSLYGDPNNTAQVQKVGQAVLNYDASQGTQPACGGYSCTFPAMTIDQIVSGINEDTGMVTADNWWASVLSRDPAINCYMIAYALEFFNHAATRTWVGCYYYEPCWGYESNRLGDILAAWPGLRKAAGM